MNTPTYIRIEGTVKRETEKAIQVLVSEVDSIELEPASLQWFPKSQIDWSESDQSEGILFVADWLLRTKELHPDDLIPEDEPSGLDVLDPDTDISF